MSAKSKGYLLTILGVLALSPDGLIIRMIGVDGLTITFWRTLFFGLVAMVIVFLQYRQNVIKVLAGFSWPEYCVMLCYGAGNIIFMYSITHTTVANTLFMLSTTPIWGALISWVFLKERVPTRTWYAILMVVIGILVISRGSVEGVGNLAGDVAALVGACILAMQFALIRKMRSAPLPVLAMSGIMTALCLSAIIDPGQASNVDIVYLFIMGAMMLPIANGLMYLGPKYLPAPEVGLLMLLETVLGPIWVWLVINENPGIYSIIGGSIVLVTLVVNTWLGLRSENIPAAARS